MKYGTNAIADSPLDDKTNEFAAILYGYGARKIVLLTEYGVGTTYIRSLFRDNWYASEWKKL